MITTKQAAYYHVVGIIDSIRDKLAVDFSLDIDYPGTYSKSRPNARLWSTCIEFTTVAKE
jgi:hypothetical protein